MIKNNQKLKIEPYSEETNTEEFELVPAISIYNGNVVIIEGKNYKILKSKEGKILNLIELSETLFSRFKKLLILDINGIMRNNPQLDIIQKISELGETWVEPGVRIAENIIDILTVGAEFVVIGTKTLENISELKEVTHLSQKVIVSIDYSNEIVTPNAKKITLKDILLQSKSFDIDKIIFADLQRISIQTQLQSEIIKSIVAHGFKTYVGGGINKEDISELKNLGTKGAILELRDLI